MGRCLLPVNSFSLPLLLEGLDDIGAGCDGDLHQLRLVGRQRLWIKKEEKGMVIYYLACTRSIMVTSGGARNRMGGPHVPVPRLR